MENFELSLTWGDRVRICNLFPTVGSLEDMKASHIMRKVLIEDVPASDLQKNGIEYSHTMERYYIPEKNEGRQSSIVLDEVALRAFGDFIFNLSTKRQIHISNTVVFTTVMDQYNELTKGGEK